MTSNARALSLNRTSAPLAAAFCLLGAIPAAAHDLGVIRGELVEVAAARYALELELPSGLDDIEPVYPERCRAFGELLSSQLRIPNLFFVELDCGTVPLGEADSIHLRWQSDGAFVKARWLDMPEAGRYFEGGESGIVLDIGSLRSVERSAGETAWHYARLGVEHILTGWDHLAFVLGLFLISRGWALAGRVTAFTVGHSLSLMLAVLGWVEVPGPPVEACIALSLAFVAREALAASSGAASPLHASWGLVFVFGLLHGLGFAGALEESGIGGGELVVGLLSFNLGVEFGQLAFVATLMAVAVAWNRLQVRSLGGRKAAYALGVLGVFWTVERLVAFVAPVSFH